MQRKEYPINEHDVFLNHAATSPISYKAIARMQSLAAEMNRPLNEHFYPWLGIIEDTRRRLSELIHVHPSTIAFCQNTSSALSLIANAIPFKTGDKIIVPRDEFPSNIYAWQNLRNKGITFDFFDVEPGVPMVETLKKINLDKVKLISISAVSYLTGRLYELNEIAAFCHERNIYICYDAIQAIGATDFNAEDIGVDFVASGAQKWLLGSTGVGFFYVKKSLLPELHVPLAGWTSVKYPENFSLKELDFASEMTRFEPGLPDVLPIASLNQSLRDLSTYGFSKIFNEIKQHVTYLTDALNDKGIKTFAQHDNTAGIVSFDMPKNINPEKLNKHLVQNKIHLTQREGYLRISPHFYNSKADIDKLLSSLELASSRTYPVPSEKVIPSIKDQDKTIILTGASGMLGKFIAFELVKKGYHLVLVSKSLDKLKHVSSEALKQNKHENQHINIACEEADFNAPGEIEALLSRLKSSGKKYYGLINCAGLAESDEFVNLDAAKLKEMFSVNCMAPFQLMQCFINELRSIDALGILNIVSPTGRIGYPLLSGYAATNAALWQLGEVVARECCHEQFTVTTYIAPPMHSPMQKRLGRAALRYFKLSGDFPYDMPLRVAQEAITAFQSKKEIYISKDNRWMLIINSLFPALISRKIKKIWKV